MVKQVSAVAVAGISMFTCPMALCDTLYSIKSDTSSAASFVSGAMFYDGTPSKPSSGNSYVVRSSHVIRTPNLVAKASTNIVFGGDSLWLGTGSDSDGMGQFALKTVYTNVSAKATVTIDDFRLYWSRVNLASSGRGCIAGKITVYATDPSKAAEFAIEADRVLEIASAISGAAEAQMKFSGIGGGFMVTGDMSEYLGDLNVSIDGGFIVLASPYSARGTIMGENARLVLKTGFSYQGSGSMALSSGTRFMASYDSSSGTTVPVSLDATHFTLADGPFELSLDGESLPSAASFAGKTLPVVRIPTALREVSEEDFVDVTSDMPNECGLPRRAISIDVANGVQTISIVTRPYVKLSDAVAKDNPNRSNKRWYLTDAEAWSDGEAPSPEKDYLVDRTVKNSLRTGADSDSTFTFKGGSLTLNQNLAHKDGSLNVTDLILCGGAGVISSAKAKSLPWQQIEGAMELLNSSWDAPAMLRLYNNQPLELKSSLKGSGTLKFAIDDAAEEYGRITGDNSSYFGQIRVGYYNSSMGDGRKVVLEFDEPKNLGGSLAEFDYRALGLDPDCALAPRKPMTLATENRGLWVDTRGRIIVTNGTFGVKLPIRMTGSLVKLGDGVLALGGDVSFGPDGTDSPTGANNVLDVQAGGIMALTTNGLARLSVSFASGSCLVADAAAMDDGVRRYGLFNEYGVFNLPVGGKLRVRVVGCDDSNHDRYYVPLCTVTPTAASALEGNIVVDELRGWTVSVRRENISVNGGAMVRFLARCSRNGLTIVVR